ncbi:MAG: glycosyltransferase family 4 protein, partial [Flavobacteriales bacterium]
VTVLGFDNAYNGSIRQRLALVYARFQLTPFFKFVFVPGLQQKEFALRMGFSPQQIHTGAYSCDYDYYSTHFKRNIDKKLVDFPRRFIYVGRYTEVKGIENLWDVFEEISNEQPLNWELWCIGTGNIEPRTHDKIKHFGFVQPSDMGKYLADTSVFVLPSTFEPWGLVVHEFAAAGYPLVLSDKVGAKESFLVNNHNGYLFESTSKSQLKNCLKNIIKSSPDKLIEMGKRSADLAAKNTPREWAEKLFGMVQS